MNTIVLTGMLLMPFDWRPAPPPAPSMTEENIVYQTGTVKKQSLLDEDGKPTTWYAIESGERIWRLETHSDLSDYVGKNILVYGTMVEGRIKVSYYQAMEK